LRTDPAALTKEGNMRKAILLTVALAAAVSVTGCNKGALASADTTKIEKQLRDNEAKWNAAYAARDSEALAGAYATDAALANPGSELVTGTVGIRREVAAFASDPNLKVDFAADRIQVAASGDLAYTRGHYKLTSTDPDTKKPADSAGSYLTVWQKQSDGNWKAVEDFITPGPAPVSPAAK
jgi:uncharacterized protein (TIGR02246 family)